LTSISKTWESRTELLSKYINTNIKLDVMKKKFIVLILILVFVIGIFYTVNPSKIFGKIFNKNSDTDFNTRSNADSDILATSPLKPISVPNTSASAITSPPPSMKGINTHTEVYGTGADPNIITLGPKLGAHPDWPTYSAKCGMEFELKHGTPLLAPVDMVFVGFSNRNAKYRIQNGKENTPVNNTPYNDLQLWFESASPDWPGMIVTVYHLYSSPLLLGHYQNPDCAEREEWGSTKEDQAEGHLFGAFGDNIIPKQGNASACEALIGRTVKRGELFGFAGSVGTHSMAAFCAEVPNTSENPNIKKGNHYLHLVQPSIFFYWKCYSPDADFPSGVLAYPFECDEYQLPDEQRDINFKYTSTK
jgi:hypothetical protein